VPGLCEGRPREAAPRSLQQSSPRIRGTVDRKQFPTTSGSSTWRAGGGLGVKTSAKRASPSTSFPPPHGGTATRQVQPSGSSTWRAGAAWAKDEREGGLASFKPAAAQKGNRDRAVCTSAASTRGRPAGGWRGTVAEKVRSPPTKSFRRPDRGDPRTRVVRTSACFGKRFRPRRAGEDEDQGSRSASTSPRPPGSGYGPRRRNSPSTFHKHGPLACWRKERARRGPLASTSSPPGQGTRGAQHNNPRQLLLRYGSAAGWRKDERKLLALFKPRRRNRRTPTRNRAPRPSSPLLGGRPGAGEDEPEAAPPSTKTRLPAQPRKPLSRDQPRLLLRAWPRRAGRKNYGEGPPRLLQARPA